MGVGADAEPLDQLLDLFASDAILASQFFGLRRSVPASYRPVQKLMLAVLADGIDDLLVHRGPVRLRGRRRAEADEWLFDEAAAVPFSFAWICDGLGIDASYLRAGIRRLEAKLRSSNGS